LEYAWLLRLLLLRLPHPGLASTDEGSTRPFLSQQEYSPSAAFLRRRYLASEPKADMQGVSCSLVLAFECGCSAYRLSPTQVTVLGLTPWPCGGGTRGRGARGSGRTGSAWRGHWKW